MKKGHVYFDSGANEKVEFRYMGQTGLAIVCEPGDSGGGMQSCWGMEPDRLVCNDCGNQAATPEQLKLRSDYIQDARPIAVSNGTEESWNGIRTAVGVPQVAPWLQQEIQSQQPTQTQNQPQEPAPAEQAKLLQSDPNFPKYQQIIVLIRQKNWQEAETLANELGTSIKEIQQMVASAYSSGKMVKTAGLFTWFSGLGNKGKKSAAGIALALVLMGLGSSVFAEQPTGEAPSNQPGVEQTTGSEPLGGQSELGGANTPTGQSTFTFNEISTDQLGSMNAEQLQDVAEKAEASMKQQQASVDQLKEWQSNPEQAQEEDPNFMSHGRYSDILAKKIALLEQSLDQQANFVSTVYNAMSAQQSGGATQAQPTAQPTEAPQGLSGMGKEGIL